MSTAEQWSVWVGDMVKIINTSSSRRGKLNHSWVVSVVLELDRRRRTLENENRMLREWNASLRKDASV